MNIIPIIIRTRSSAFARRLRSLNIMAPHAKDISTELRLTSDTTEIMDSGSFSEVKYAKSPMHMNMDMSGIAQLHLKDVV